jgi:hypothetical protein
VVVDLTGVATSCIAGFFGLLSVAVPSILDRHMKNQAAREVMTRAITASLGALQQSSTTIGQMLAPRVTIANVPDRLAPAVQYIIDNAGPEMEQLGITPERAAAKVLAEIGLRQIAVNTAVAASPAPITPDPLGPIPPSPLTTGRGNGNPL